MYCLEVIKALNAKDAAVPKQQIYPLMRDANGVVYAAAFRAFHATTELEKSTKAFWVLVHAALER